MGHTRWLHDNTSSARSQSQIIIRKHWSTGLWWQGTRQGCLFFNLQAQISTTTQPKMRNSQQVCRQLVTDLLTASPYQDPYAWLASCDIFSGQVCCKHRSCKLSTDLLQVNFQNLLSTCLLQIVSTSCNTSANAKLLIQLTDLFRWNWWNWQDLLTSCNKLVKCWHVATGLWRSQLWNAQVWAILVQVIMPL